MCKKFLRHITSLRCEIFYYVNLFAVHLKVFFFSGKKQILCFIKDFKSGQKLQQKEFTQRSLYCTVCILPLSYYYTVWNKMISSSSL
jgi:hypothetical protein